MPDDLAAWREHILDPEFGDDHEVSANDPDLGSPVVDLAADATTWTDAHATIHGTNGATITGGGIIPGQIVYNGRTVDPDEITRWAAAQHRRENRWWRRAWAARWWR